MQRATSETRPDELTTALERIEPEIRKVFVRFRIPAQDAEDLLQEVVLAYWRRHTEIASPAPWLLGALTRLCLHYWRSRRRRFIEALDEGLLEELAGAAPGSQEREDLARDLSGAVAQLPGRCRTIFRLRYGLDCDGPEIARELGYRQDTLRQVTLRCLSALSRQLLAGGYAQEVCP